MDVVPERYRPVDAVRVRHPEWVRDAAIYQVNVRQFTREGTIAAAAEHLPRLAGLGVGILLLMPVHDIGVVNRKGTLGSPYAVRDYHSVSPELGTLDDLRDYVRRAHELGMRVILDWVANHTAWDNPLVTEHPEWYERDWKGDLRPTPWWDWRDVVDLDYGRPELRAWMTRAMQYWVTEADVDGFRCDAAGFVPTDFWETARADLEAVKEVFLLAEWESRDLHLAAFDATYAWSWNEAMHRIASGLADVSALHVYYSWNEKAFPADSLRMTFVSNHDKNAWEGTEYEQFGDALEAAIVLSVVGEGIPLIYSGQEAGNTRRLQFFERDPIDWVEHPMGQFYQRLLTLKKDCPALWNGRSGARMVQVPNDRHTAVLSFVRDHPRGRVLAVLNLSAAATDVRFADRLHHGAYTEFFSGAEQTFDAGSALRMPPWSYRVYLGRRDSR
jgi:1,4-alpha-glucan branching enzyme